MRFGQGAAGAHVNSVLRAETVVSPRACFTDLVCSVARHGSRFFSITFAVR